MKFLKTFVSLIAEIKHLILCEAKFFFGEKRSYI